MDLHEPKVTTVSQEAFDKPTTVRDILALAGETLRENGKKISTGATAVVLALVLAGCGSNASSEGPKPEVTVSAEATPSATPEAPAPSDVITSLEGVGYLTFEQADPSEKRAYAQHFIDERKDRHASITGDYDRTTWTEPLIDMDGQQIVDNWMYVLDEAGITDEFDAEKEAHLLDHDQAIKILSGAFYSTDDFADNSMYPSPYNGTVEFLLSRDEGYVTQDGADKKTVQNTTELSEGIGPSGEAIQFKDISYTNPQGEASVARFVYTTFSNVDGEDQSTWLFLNFVNQ